MSLSVNRNVRLPNAVLRETKPRTVNIHICEVAKHARSEQHSSTRFVDILRGYAAGALTGSCAELSVTFACLHTGLYAYKCGGLLTWLCACIVNSQGTLHPPTRVSDENGIRKYAIWS
jgi:hypothetical protein